MKLLTGVFLALSLQIGNACAETLADIRNFKQYSDTFASAGQPLREQFKLLKEQQFDQVIYIAFSNSQGAIANEDELIKDLGIAYFQIPVSWDQPTKRDFHSVATLLKDSSGKKTLLHCQANYRASAFAFLYRVIYQNVDIAQAKADMNEIWHPDGQWRDLIFEVLSNHGLSPDCARCDWSVPKKDN